MSTRLHSLLALGLIALTAPFLASAKNSKPFPDPVVDTPAGEGAGMQTAVFAGGCFWGVEAVFEHLKGVKSAVAGYSGGAQKTAQYELVSMGDTGHAESVKVTYDPAQISYGKLLKVFFSVAHDPTELNRQGPDTGTQYRSVIFYGDDEQKKVADAYIQQLNQAGLFSKQIVTQVVPLKAFYQAEQHHQHFVDQNPFYPYVMYNDLPKLSHLKKEYPELCKR